MSSPTKIRQDRRSGVVLVIVLGVTMVAAWLAIEILAGIRKELALKSAPQSEARLRHTAYQLLEISIGVLAEIRQFEGALYSPAQGWGFPLSYAGMEDTRVLQSAVSDDFNQDVVFAEAASELGSESLPFETDDAAAAAESISGEELLDDLLAESDGATLREDGFAREMLEVRPGSEGINMSTEMAALVLPDGLQARVRLYDESGKLSLQATSSDRWVLFFQEMGFEESESKALTDSLLDWMDADDDERENGAETLTYSQLDPPYFAPNRTLRDFEELRYLSTFKNSFFDEQGLPNENFQLFKNNVSLYHSDEVNLNGASLLVLQTLAEEKSFEADNVMNFLAGADLTFGTEDDRILRPGLEETDLPKDDNGNPIQLNRPVRFIRAEISVSDGQSVFYLNSILDLSAPQPGGIYPFKIVRIIENQPIS